MSQVVSVLAVFGIDPAIVGWLLALVAVAVVSWTLSRRTNKWDQCSSDMPDVKSTLVDIKEELLMIKLILSKSGSESFAKGESPLKLTDLGKKAVDSLEAESFIAENFSTLKSLAEADNPQTAYDLQLACLKVADKQIPDMLTPKQLNNAKEHAFQSSLPLSSVYIVFGVLLRDRLMAERNWPIDGANANS